MAGGSTAPTEITDGTSHINPTYDSDEDGVIEQARDADNLGGNPPSNYETPTSTQSVGTQAGWLDTGGHQDAGIGETITQTNDVFSTIDAVRVWVSGIDDMTTEFEADILDEDGNVKHNTTTVTESETISNSYTITISVPEQFAARVQYKTTVTDSNAANNDLAFRSHFVSLPIHSHNI